MSNKLKELRAKEGFTIIEVIIVLVIGAVIMLAVFLVVPQLQRTQRNSRAQNDVRRILTAAEQYAANNNNTYPNCGASATADKPLLTAGPNACTVITNITGDVKTPTNTDYATVVVAPTTTGQIAIVKNVTGCASPGTTPDFAAGTKFMVVTFNDGGGTYCLEAPK